MINTIIIDCDGCLTDGKKHINSLGSRAMVSFHSRDNTAIQRLIMEGYRVIIVTASNFPGIRRYWMKYNVEVYFTKEKEKIEGIEWDKAIGIGDDVMDIPFLEKCALAYVPVDAHPSLLSKFEVLICRGGSGIMEEIAVRLNGLFPIMQANYIYNGKTNRKDAKE